MAISIPLSDKDPALRKLIGLAGGMKSLADKLGVTKSSLSSWKHVPTRHVLKAEAEFSGQITRHEMRPDLFGDGA